MKNLVFLKEHGVSVKNDKRESVKVKVAGAVLFNCLKYVKMCKGTKGTYLKFLLYVPVLELSYNNT